MYLVAKKDDPDAVAAAWVVRLDREELSAAEQQQLDAWIGAHPAHMGAFVRAQSVWAKIDRVAALDAGRAATPTEAPRWAKRWLAASLAASLVIASVVAFNHFSGRETTRLGEIRRFLLQDGSGIVLNASSVVQVKYEPNERRVVLREGEASFNVAHNVERPFIVQARDVAVRAVGTSFSVRLLPHTVSIIVTEGAVEITRPSTRPGETTVKEVKIVARNRQLVAPAAQPMMVASLSNQEVSRRMAWQEGLLVFDGQQLAQAVTEVNRYSPIPIVVDDASLGQKTFVGVFRVGDAQAFVDAAAAAFGAHVNARDDGLHLGD